MKAKEVLFILTALFVVVLSFTIFSHKSIDNFVSNDPQNPVIQEIKRRFAMIDPKYGNIPLKVGDKSYTEDKAVITLCILNPETKDYYDINVLMYVALHELSHVITKASGNDSHADEFKHNFTKLLREASNRGVYDPKQPIPVTYCGGNDDD